ncbi:MAG: hypothetical protein BGO43_04730 [Gammaproteobacteria bacterium 39-13]|nr:hypothetical protein [Gammaproteobacteria bacterium]OJV96158.1 MAG: hypothetical protein BGO43_04730 [Gammaproteobacteria bacterium 39-13]
MPYFHVSHKDLKVLDKKGNPLKITAEKALSVLAINPEKAKAKDKFVVFDNYDAALEYAQHGVDEQDHEHFLIYEVELLDEKKLEATKQELTAENDEGEEEVVNEIDAFETPVKNVKFLNVKLDHIHDDFKDIVINKPSKKDAKSSDKKSGDKKSNDKNDDAQGPSFVARATNALKNMAIPGATVLGVGAGFHFSGVYPLVAAGLAKAGLVLPAVGAAGIAAQVGVAGLVGVAAYGLGLASWHVGTSLVSSVRNTYTNYMKTKKERYEDEVKSKTAQVEALEKDLGLADDNEIVVKFNDLLGKGVTPKFDDKGELAKEGQPKKQTKAMLLQWEIDKLNAYKKASNDEDKKAVVEEIKKGPKLSLS